MIHLITGQPGAGKTLFTLVTVRERAEREGRTVYYSGIADCRVPGWIEIEDATRWHELPPKSIVLIDEAQRVFRPRATGAAVPMHVAALETHRHAGIDLYLITQHPKLLDANVRRLVGEHVHVMRAWGAKVAVLHRWNECRADPDVSREGSITETRKYPREAFQWYRSAEAHTHRARVPLRVWLVLGSPLLLAGLAWGVYELIASRFSGEASPVLQQAQATIGGTEASTSGRPVSGRPASTREYLEAHRPRVEGLPHTAPVYDEVTVARTAPVPVACIASAQRCRCWSQQATAIEVPDDLCRRIVRDGFFISWAEPEASGPPSSTASPQPVRRDAVSEGIVSLAPPRGAVEASGLVGDLGTVR